MTTQTRIQLSLQRDSGSIFYQDKHDNLTFHIEALRSTTSTASSSTTTQSPPAARNNNKNKKMASSSSDQASQASTALTSDSEHEVETRRTAPSAAAAAASRDDDESEAETDLIKSFLRQHLLKNGEPSRCLIPLMKKDGIEAMLIATVALHLRKDGGLASGEEDHRREGKGSVRDDGAAIRSLHRTLGSLVAVLQQRERVLTYLEENPHVVVAPRSEAGEK